MGASSGTIELSKMEIKTVQKFYEWLQGGENPESIDFKTKPKLTAEEAFSVIYYLQEELCILPDCYEQCRECKCLYDSYEEGVSICEDSTIIDDEGNEINRNLYCESCRPN